MIVQVVPSAVVRASFRVKNKLHPFRVLQQLRQIVERSVIFPRVSRPKLVPSFGQHVHDALEIAEKLDVLAQLNEILGKSRLENEAHDVKAANVGMEVRKVTGEQTVDGLWGAQERRAQENIGVHILVHPSCVARCCELREPREQHAAETVTHQHNFLLVVLMIRALDDVHEVGEVAVTGL